MNKFLNLYVAWLCVENQSIQNDYRLQDIERALERSLWSCWLGSVGLLFPCLKQRLGWDCKMTGTQITASVVGGNSFLSWNFDNGSMWVVFHLERNVAPSKCYGIYGWGSFLYHLEQDPSPCHTKERESHRVFDEQGVVLRWHQQGWTEWKQGQEWRDVNSSHTQSDDHFKCYSVPSKCVYVLLYVLWYRQIVLHRAPRQYFTGLGWIHTHSRHFTFKRTNV